MSSGPNHQKKTKSPDSSGEALLDPCLAPFNRHPWQSTLAIPYCCNAGEGTLYNVFVPEAEVQGYVQDTPWRDGYVCKCLVSLDITLLHTLASITNGTIGISLCPSRLASIWNIVVDISPLCPAEVFLFPRDLQLLSL